jgi:hypothetical protein
MNTEQNNPAASFDNLPVLTEIVGQNAFDDLPTLTEVVTTEAAPEKPAEWVDTITLPEPCIANEGAANTTTVPTPPGSVINEIGNETIISSVVVLPPIVPAQGISEEQLQQLLNKLQHRLEGKLMQQLAPQIAKLQQQAMEQALNELRAEIPALLRHALNLNDSNK